MSEPIQLDTYQRLATRHGHFCPMSTLGVRLGEALLRLLSPEDLVGGDLVYQHRTCAVDGISQILEDSGVPIVLKVDDRRRHRLVASTTGGRELSACLSEEALQLAARYRTLDESAQPEHLEMMRSVEVGRLVFVDERRDT